jgi:hypothetical protein
LTGCTGTGGNSNFVRPNAATPRLTPPTAAAAPANGSAWARQPAATGAKPPGDPSALANPTGNTPQFNVQPTGGMTPAGGLAPPTALPAAPTPAATGLPTGPTTSNLMPTAPSINSLNAGTPVSAAPVPARQVAANAIRTPEPTTRMNPTPPAAVEEPPAPAPPIPPAAAASEVPLNPPPQITTLSPLPQPTKVRQ